MSEDYSSIVKSNILCNSVLPDSADKDFKEISEVVKDVDFVYDNMVRDLKNLEKEIVKYAEVGDVEDGVSVELLLGYRLPRSLREKGYRFVCPTEVPPFSCVFGTRDDAVRYATWIVCLTGAELLMVEDEEEIGCCCKECGPQKEVGVGVQVYST